MEGEVLLYIFIFLFNLYEHHYYYFFQEGEEEEEEGGRERIDRLL